MQVKPRSLAHCWASAHSDQTLQPSCTPEYWAALHALSYELVYHTPNPVPCPRCCREYGECGLYTGSTHQFYSVNPVSWSLPFRLLGIHPFVDLGLSPDPPPIVSLCPGPLSNELGSKDPAGGRQKYGYLKPSRQGSYSGRGGWEPPMSRPIGHAPPRSPDASRPSIVGETGVYGSQWVMRCRHGRGGL